MKQVPYTHPDDAPNPTNIGGKLLHPGDTRLVDASLVPGAATRAPPAAEVPAAETDMATLRADSVRGIEAKLDQLTDEQLHELHALETADSKPRKGVIEGIDEALLKREAARAEEDDGAENTAEGGDDAGDE